MVYSSCSRSLSVSTTPLTRATRRPVTVGAGAVDAGFAKEVGAWEATCAWTAERHKTSAAQIWSWCFMALSLFLENGESVVVSPSHANKLEGGRDGKATIHFVG